MLRMTEGQLSSMDDVAAVVTDEKKLFSYSFLSFLVGCVDPSCSCMSGVLELVSECKSRSQVPCPVLPFIGRAV